LRPSGEKTELDKSYPVPIDVCGSTGGQGTHMKGHELGVSITMAARYEAKLMLRGCRSGWQWKEVFRLVELWWSVSR
jgi:hypothetical protein